MGHPPRDPVGQRWAGRLGGGAQPPLACAFDLVGHPPRDPAGQRWAGRLALDLR
ncbi:MULTISPECIES: hypothetical protein [unclassified Paenibacillus]|uniref:hypothetical protein n=1 Tax=unclassified Paenibacillus TaxID=185978 RepID=UPI0024060039|nr:MULTISPECIES: hypothetical protein [unclassified Paenibacillus]MDF9843196.1 hypothetical protein [Paenibacillus sp. PastF-2]MDF9849784.1 hypothetical protein [Paenibacillus sp. PastM-2]MDF9856491.1 hypothetical protein [Paenibacillus sp. PastF-1]